MSIAQMEYQMRRAERAFGRAQIEGRYAAADRFMRQVTKWTARIWGAE